MPAKGQPALLELLLRQPQPPRLERGGQPFQPFGAIQCCMPSDVVTQANARTVRPRHAAPLVFPPGSKGALKLRARAGAEGVCNTLWPLASECWMDYAGAKGANAFHFRMGPFRGDADHELDWSATGGPYRAETLEWNPSFWERVRELTWYAGSARRSTVEAVVVDTWGCKVSQWGSDYTPWPAADIDACGRRPSSEQERYIRKVVEELGCFANVIWITDNEGDQIQGDTRDWYEWVRAVIRDEEQKSGCGIVHMVGTNNPAHADGPFDYVATHARAPLAAPLAGKHSENNERNPHFSPEQELANFCQARAAGLHWWFWRAEMSFAEMDRTLNLFHQGCGGAPGCFPPPDDGQWQELGAAGGTRADEVKAGQQALGSLCKEPPAHQNGLDAIAALNTRLRASGYCAGTVGAEDAVMIQAEDEALVFEEHHAVSPFDSGCWAENPAFYPKNRWRYVGVWSPPPAPACPHDVPTVDEILCKPHVPLGTWDCTPKAGGRPILPEGDPNRWACELEAMGGAAPSYQLETQTGAIALTQLENPMQFKITGSGTGIVRCFVPAVSGALCNTAVSR